MKTTFITCLLVLSIGVYAEVPGDTTLLQPTNSSIEIPFNPRFENSFQLRKLTLNTPVFSDFEQNILPPLPDFNLNSLIDYNTTAFPMQHVVPQFNLKNSLYYTHIIDEDHWISTSRIQAQHIGLGGSNTMGAMYNIRLNDRMILSTGLYAGKYIASGLFGYEYRLNQNFNDVGVNGNIRFELTDRVSMNVFGNYSLNNNRTSYPDIFSQTNYGGSFEFKITDSWGIVTGATREFDVIQRKWITSPFIYPVFYGR